VDSFQNIQLNMGCGTLPAMPEKKTCFVVMGFGKKTDYPTGRVLDLDKSYRTIIRPAALAAGLDCKRADDIIHSGIIDVPMYQQLLTADVVVADLSTYNCNAFYELGVRHALRPYTTITIAEDKMVYPFDANHIAIRKYQHLGEGIDFEEVKRMSAALQEAIEIIANTPVNDSPVYAFLKNLKPPVVEETTKAAATVALGAAPSMGTAESVSAYMEMANDAMDSSDFVTARAVLEKIRKMLPTEPYILQKLALATYKSQLPTPRKALDDARKILEGLNPAISTDTETLGLWAAIHKRMWEQTQDPTQLDSAIFAHEKGFYLKNDYYNGVNLAYLLNLRASLDVDKTEAVADFVLAQRTRRRLVGICENLLANKPLPSEMYWIMVTLAEAWIGLGDDVKGRAHLDQALALIPSPADWMKESTTLQLARLRTLLANSPLDQIV
jgi:MAP3K TRAFs-binding domain